MRRKDFAIKVEVKVEGLSEIENLPVSLPDGSKLEDLFSTLVVIYGEKVRPFLYNTLTGELGVFAVIINNKMVRLPQEIDHILADGDEVFIISPLGGG